MSPIIINSTNPIIHKSNNLDDEEKGEEDTEKAREERKQTGRSIAIIIFLSLMCLALYHVIQRKTTILAGVLVPALILFAYTFFVIHISNRDKKRRKQLEAEELKRLNEESKSDVTKKSSVFSSPSASTASFPSTSSKQAILVQQSSQIKLPKSNLKTLDEINKSAKLKNSSNVNKMNASSGVKKKNSFKKIPSHSNIQVKSNQSATCMIVENEKLKRSRSFDKRNHQESSRHFTVDNKKTKTKH
ncbi:hypothetical protein PVAND_011629 [Polypedilum vanderplanki]|uniref:Transmembrane protein n=1 Tax=Polypedilum vanderplanki TaxID=319348 RepID=A0A9J6CJ71_POLVA|nr:hypothetical protein PVAND_011629 [Polypedilum vanderplanki]